MNNPNTVGFNIDEIRKLAEALADYAKKACNGNYYRYWTHI